MLQGVEKVCVGGRAGGGFLNVHVGIWLLPLKWEGREREDERKTK